MTALLSQAFKKASQLPKPTQNELAEELLHDIASEMKWEQAFATSQDKLEMLATKALKEFKAGKTKKMGFELL